MFYNHHLYGSSPCESIVHMISKRNALEIAEIFFKHLLANYLLLAEGTILNKECVGSLSSVHPLHLQ